MTSAAVANQAAGQIPAQLLIGTNAQPPVYTAIAEVSKMQGPQLSRATIDVTSLDSEGASEFIVGMTDSGNVSFTINYNPTAHEALRTSTTNTNFQIQLPGPTTSLGTLTFIGVVTKFDWDFDETKQMTAAVTIQVSGPVTFTAPV